MATFISHSPEQTQEFAAALGQRLPGGTVIGLVGDLGAGKTQFVKGFARGLGITEPVLSPTFALLHIYLGARLPLYHLDLYRLESQEQILAAGLEEYLQPDGITLVEWWDRWQGHPPSSLRVFKMTEVNETTRQIAYDEHDHAGA
jgi:tRNA threonylcarbamoyladenosine biosynthesis protein TsaE